MKNTTQDTSVVEQSALQPFVVEQAMAGLELGDMDAPLLQYLDFLSEQIPVKAAYFLHVVPRFDLFRSLFDKDAQALSGEFVISNSIRERMAEKIDRYLSQEESMDLRFEVREGNPLEELLKDQETIDADLVVIGQKARANSHGILAKRLARKVTANALVVPEKARRSLEQILVPVDFSDYSVKALQTALAINKQLDIPAKISCIHIYEVPDFASFSISMAQEQFRQMIEGDRREALQAFIKRYAGEERAGIEAVLFNQDMPRTATYLMDYATEKGTDLIVMGAKGHSTVARMFMGSVTEKLLSINDQIPTLVVK